ncbi:hypothetical protein [Streptomyces chrestomyceticus]|uniref:Uncharacterized protein n=1 Tax=Streptomyces chrestomyceticus TaxID=68185 RepID=A0ABU7WNX1_9ACTN
MEFIQSWESLDAEMLKFERWLHEEFYWKNLPDADFARRYERIRQLLADTRKCKTSLRLLGLLPKQAAELCDDAETALSVAHKMRTDRKREDYDHYDHTDEMADITGFSRLDFATFCEAANSNLAGVTCETAWREAIDRIYGDDAVG